MTAKGGAKAAAAAATALWTRALQDTFPDVEWVDSELELEGGGRIDWVGVDATGRVVFALFCDGAGEKALISAIDALVFFVRNRPVLAQHLHSARVRTALDPVVALIAESFSEQLLARLTGVGGSSLRVFELRRLSSSRGERAYLVPLSPAIGRTAPPDRRGPDAFLAALSEDCRKVGELLVRRLSRIDDRLVATSGERSLSWQLGEALLCSIAEIEGAIEGQIPSGAPLGRIADAAQVERFVDKVLERYVTLLGDAAPGGTIDTPMLATVDAGMTLTAEEIAAFRQSG